MNDPTASDSAGNEPLEARIVAWVLGEASAFEAAELARLCGERPELQVFRRRMHALHGLLTEAEATQNDPAWKLAPAKRKLLDEILGEENVAVFESQKDRRIRRAGWRAFAGIAACLVLALVVLQLFGPLVSIETIVEPERSVDFMPPGGAGGVAAAGEDGQDLSEAIRAQDYVGAKRDFETDQALLQQMKLKRIEGSIALNAAAPPAPAEGGMPQVTAVSPRPGRASALRSGDEAKKDYEEVLRTDPTNSAARRGIEKITAAKSDYYRAAYDHTRAELLAEVDSAWELAVPADELEGLALADSDAAQPERAGLIPAEKVQTPLESMEEIAAAENPFSTFSLNISDASFQLAKAAIGKGERPDPEGIKVEQFYNAVDYGDSAPGTNEPVAAKIEQSAHPVIPGRNLVRVALRAGSAGRAASQPLRLTLLVDQSGSMVREDRRAAMEHALDQLGMLLTPQDRVNVIGFSRRSRLLADGLPGDQAGELGELVHQSASEGGTNLEDAMKLGEQMAARHQLAGAQNRIVLFTDGAVNLGDADPAKLADQVAALRQKGIAFDIAGIGTDGLNDRLLSEMARNGNGRYYVIGKEMDGSFARQLAGAFRPAAENVKVQVKFNPGRVGRYQLLGFEKDRLRTEDFRDDSVDAAELAAEEAGVAVYQIEPLGGGKGEIGEVSVRFRDAASGEMHERSWTISHDPATAAFDRATPSMQLAGLSLLAAEKLRGGALADAIDFKQLAGPRAAVKQHYANSPRVGDMLRVIDALE